MFGEEESHVRLFFHRQDLTHRLDIHLKKRGSKGIALDGVPLRRSGELLGLLQVVFFAPEDLAIIKNGPQFRRKFMDLRMSQLDKGYIKYLADYTKLLNERNNLLKQIHYQPELKDTLGGWDSQLLQIGSVIIQKRADFVKNLNEIMQDIHQRLTGGREKIMVSYDASISEEEFALTLAQRQEMDLKNGSTSVGPHRDDLSFVVNGIDIRHYGSQGQQRTAALSLKLAEIQMIEDQTKEKPILLLDDVLSELDAHRQEYLLGSISQIQTLISCTGLDDFVRSRMVMDQIFYVQDGTVEKYGSYPLSED